MYSYDDAEKAVIDMNDLDTHGFLHIHLLQDSCLSDDDKNTLLRSLYPKRARNDLPDFDNIEEEISFHFTDVAC